MTPSPAEEGTAERGGAAGTVETLVRLRPPTAVGSAGALVPYLSPGLPAEQAVVSMTRVLLGAVDLAAAALTAVLERSSVAARSAGRQPPVTRPRPARLPLAAVSLGLQTQRRGLQAAVAAQRRAAAAVAATTRLAPIRGGLNAVQQRLDDLARRGLAEQHHNRQAARDFVDVLVTELTGSVLDRIDLDAVIARVDLDQLMQGLDLDQVVARVDIDAIVSRLDLAAVIRESTSTMTDQTVQELRIQGMQADHALGRAFDRLLRRPGSPP